VHTHPRLFQQIILEEAALPVERRSVKFIFNASGNTGKTVLADYMELNPDINALLAMQLATPERYASALIDQFESFKQKNGNYPKVIIFDFTRNEDNTNIESVYSIMEKMKDGRIDSSFYGRAKRIRFSSPHIFVFTNAVPNLNALSGDRFNLRVIADQRFNFAAFKCNIELEVKAATRGLVSWAYNASVSAFHDQEEYYSSILSPQLLEELYTSLSTLDGQIYLEKFRGDLRTSPLSKAPEEVMKLVNARPI